MNQNLSTLTKIGNWIATLLLGNTRELIIRIDERVNNLTADMKDVKSTLKEHGEKIAALMVYTGYNVRNSPNMPSEKGKELLRKSGFDEIYPQLRERVFASMKARNPRTLYDYEKEAERSLGSLRDDPLMDRLKDYVVEHADQPLVLIFEIASWVIRDDYAKEHPLPPR
ncbi:MAG TPA: hypothetical protein VMR99_02660 [Candidatus Paceibacterota bacterium]|nr:hypothetical protein [Candidatus Paceibacterota bacterium]